MTIPVTGGFTALDGRTTIYTYALTSINDRALRFSDFNTLNGVATNQAAFTYNAIGRNSYSYGLSDTDNWSYLSYQQYLG